MNLARRGLPAAAGGDEPAMKSDGWKLIAMCLVAACGFFVLPLKADGAAGAKPETIPEATRQLLGLYQGDGGRFLVRERDGVLEMLFEVEPGGGEAIKDFTVFPLREIAGDVYRLIGDGPGQVRRETVRFTRDAAGYSILCPARRRDSHARQREQGEYRYSLWSLHRHPLLFVMPVPVRRCLSLSTGNANCAVQANISTITSCEGCF